MGEIDKKRRDFKLHFRLIDMGDIQALFAIYSDKEAMKYRGSKAMSDLEDARDFVRTQDTIEANKHTIRKAVICMDTKELLGTVMFRYDHTKKHQCELGYSIGPKYWGQGYGKMIVGKMIAVLKEQEVITELIAWSHRDNFASIKILESYGFRSIQHSGIKAHRLYRKSI